MHQRYLDDLYELASRAAAEGRLSRRHFLALAGATGVAGAMLGAKPAKAGDKIVFWDWGGDAVSCHKQVLLEPFGKQSGLGYAVDPSGPSEGKMKAMVQSGKTAADICDGDLFQSSTLGAQGILEPIDYSIVDKTLFGSPGEAAEFGCGLYHYGYSMMYDSQKFGDNPPKGWADFWDTKKYPGKRALYKWGNGSFESACIAGGADPKKLYPLDVDLMLKKIGEIKDDAIFWGSGSEIQQIFQQGEVAMGIIYNNRAMLVERDTKGRYKNTWDQALVQTGAYLVLKNNPAGRDNAMKFLRMCQEPDHQVALFECLGHSPSNPEASKRVPAALKQYNCMDPENYAKQIPISDDWYVKNYEPVLDKFLGLVGR